MQILRIILHSVLIDELETDKLDLSIVNIPIV